MNFFDFTGTLTKHVMYFILIDLLCFNIGHAQDILPYQLNSEIQRHGDVRDYEISADSTRVVYLADANISGVSELFSVPIVGGDVVKFNIHGGVNRFSISPDSQRIIYSAYIWSGNDPQDFQYGLYSVPIAGGAVVKLSPTFVSGGSVREISISPDSSRVVYIADANIENVLELFSVPIAGEGAVSLNPTLDLFAHVGHGFLISADSSRVVYRVYQRTPSSSKYDLYSVPITGGVAVCLNPILEAPALVTGDFLISADSTRVVYRSALDPITRTYHRRDVYSVPITGGKAVRLNPPQASENSSVYGFSISPDSSRVVYLGRQESDEGRNLFSVPITGGSAVKLNADLVSGGFVDSNFLISADNNHVVYRVNKDEDNVEGLHSVPTIGGMPTRLDSLYARLYNGVPGFHKISADSSRVVYRAVFPSPTSTWTLYSVVTSGGQSTPVTPSVLDGQGVSYHYTITTDGTRIVYISQNERIGLRDNHAPYELYTVLIDGTTPRKLSGHLAENRLVYDFKITQNDNYVVYLADQNIDNKVELFASRLPQPENYPPKPFDELCIPIMTDNRRSALVCL